MWNVEQLNWKKIENWVTSLFNALYGNKSDQCGSIRFNVAGAWETRD